MQNALTAHADCIRLEIFMNEARDMLRVVVEDNGQGISEQVARSAGDPFAMCKEGHGGLGLALLDASVQRANGDLVVRPIETGGTAVEFCYALSHVDRPPMGDLAGTLHAIMICNPYVDFVVEMCAWPAKHEKLDMRQIRQVVGEDMRVDEPAISGWFKSRLQAMFASLY